MMCIRRRTPADEEEDDDVSSQNDLERERKHAFGYDLMARMILCYFGNWIRILSNNTILVLFGSEDQTAMRD